MLQPAPIVFVCIYVDTSRTKMHLNTVYQPSVIVMPTSLLHPYMDQVNNVNDFVIRISNLTLAISLM